MPFQQHKSLQRAFCIAKAAIHQIGFEIVEHPLYSPNLPPSEDSFTEEKSGAEQ